MIKIRCEKDLEFLSTEIDGNFIAYIKQEYYELYKYLSIGGSIREFRLHPLQSIVIFETKEEVNQLLESNEEVEFIEEVNFKSCSILRLGIYHSEDVQLCYYIMNSKEVCNNEN